MSGSTPTRKNALLLVALLFGHLVLISNNVRKSGESQRFSRPG